MNSERKSVSYSKLETYKTCPQKYNYKYVNKVDCYKVLEEPLIKGSLAHGAIEYYLLGNTKEDSFEMALVSWVTEECMLADFPAMEELQKYAYEMGMLLYRASANYLEEDAIRTKSGGVPADCLHYPPDVFSKEEKKLGLPELRLEVDNLATKLNRNFSRMSLANIAAEAYKFLLLFEVPQWHGETIGVEVCYKDNTLWKENTYWLAYIDWIFKATDGSVFIVDHKTSKSCPTPLDVAFHPQLNVYAYLYLEETGKLPDFIAINHLGTGELVVSEVSPEIMQSTIEHLRHIQNQIDIGGVHKQLPVGYGTPCISRDWKSGVVTSVCPYLDKCWPLYHKNVRHELVHFLPGVDE